MERKKPKNKAAVALSRLGHQSMTPEQRRERSRIANEAKRRKAQGISKPIWGLHPFDNEAEVIDHDTDKLKLLERSRKLLRSCYIEKLDYNPRSFDLIPEFASDRDAEVRAMQQLAELNQPKGSKRR